MVIFIVLDFLHEILLGSMLPQYMALSVCFVCSLCVHLLDYIVNCGCAPACENICVCLLGYIVGTSTPRVFVQLVTLWVSPPSCEFFHWKTIFVGSLHDAYSALRHFAKLSLSPSSAWLS